MCEMVDQYTSKSVQVFCAGYLKVNYEREIFRRVNEVEIKGWNPGEIFQQAIWSAQITDHINGKLELEE